MELKTDVLIVGGGPAGLAAALALSTYGVKVTIVTKHGWLARTPRAHVINQRTFEILRDLGIELEARSKATDYATTPDVVYCAALAGQEYGRWHAFGTGPDRSGDYMGASPCRHADLAQNILEPILLSNSLARGATIRFNTEYLSHRQDESGVRATLLDRPSRSIFEVDAQFLIGADGANSKIAQELQLPMEGPGSIGHSVNILFEADLAQYVEYRPAFLYIMITKPKAPGDIGLAVLRPTRHWHQWLLTPGYTLTEGKAELTEENAMATVRDCVGIPHLEVRIKAIDPWNMNSLRAVRYSRNRVFCMGDAVHRHPPSNGLGSNTAIQDAYNLAWKLALVVQGKANPSLLDSYDEERVPVGKQVVERSTKTLGVYEPLLKLIQSGQVDPGKHTGSKTQVTAEAQQLLHKAVSETRFDMNTHGVEMNHCYTSCAIVCDGTPERDITRDEDLYHARSTRPGSRLPHAWIQRNGRNLSTLDLVGKGRFVLLTGTGGELWVKTSSLAAQAFGLEVESYLISSEGDLTDFYGEWEAAREIASAGCLLIRPDGYICLRNQSAMTEKECHQIIFDCFASILGRQVPNEGTGR
ncbi:MAG: FAD-dependent monooxygenase [Rhodospirillales bacterium]|nr:FAD-dependent monooxygenase [Acetobacter sp.]